MPIFSQPSKPSSPRRRRPRYAEFPVCNGNFGNTEGCACNGRAIDNSEYVIKTSAKLGVSEQSLKRTACLAGDWNTSPLWVSTPHTRGRAHESIV
jgi:hypothetical protein